MTLSEKSIKQMASDIESGKIRVTLNESNDGGYIRDLRQDGWIKMTAADVETANALINDITNRRYPKLGYGDGWIPEQTEIFRYQTK
jgi:hypothetical protein